MLQYRNRKKLNIKRFTAVVLIAAAIQFALVELLLLAYSDAASDVETEYLVILGAGLNGETVSLALYNRLMAGVEYLEKNPDAKVVVSGGQGPNETITEAEAMRRFLVSRGIDENRIWLEDRSTSTMENFKFSKKVIEENSGKPIDEITFITNSFHIFRSKILASRNGLKAYAISCETPGQVIVQMYIREYFALIKSFIADK